MMDYMFLSNANVNALQHSEEINFLYHINLFDWPIEHGHKDYWEFTIVTNGTIHNCINGKTKTYGENSVFVATTKHRHFLRATDSAPVRYINIMVKEKFLLSTINALSPNLLEYLASDQFSLTISNQKISEIEKILLQINYTAPNRYKDNDNLACAAFILLISETILKQTPPSSTMPPYLTTLNLLAQSNELLTYNVNDLSSALGYSRIQLNALFKKYFGISPHKYLINHKLNYAQKLLLNTPLTVSEIAYEVGYSTPMQFYETFKKNFGVTPNQFRKSGKTNYLQ